MIDPVMRVGAHGVVVVVALTSGAPGVALELCALTTGGVVRVVDGDALNRAQPLLRAVG